MHAEASTRDVCVTNPILWSILPGQPGAVSSHIIGARGPRLSTHYVLARNRAGWRSVLHVFIVGVLLRIPTWAGGKTRTFHTERPRRPKEKQCMVCIGVRAYLCQTLCSVLKIDSKTLVRINVQFFTIIKPHSLNQMLSGLDLFVK